MAITVHKTSKTYKAEGDYQDITLNLVPENGNVVTIKTDLGEDVRVQDMPKPEFEEMVQKILALRQRYYKCLGETMPDVAALITDLT